MSELPAESNVPIWPHFLPHVLRVLNSGGAVPRRNLVERVLDAAELSEEARKETLAAGDGRADNRVGWALTNLYKAGWVERPQRAVYRITEPGRSWFLENPNASLSFSEADRLFKDYWPDTPRAGSISSTPTPISEITGLDPIEQVEFGVAQLKENVAEELLRRLRESNPTFFEDAVVSVLLAMGYGGAEQRGKRIGGSGDGGVDGVIDQDALGLDQIYVQAKRYADGNSVGRESIQAFMGALHGFGAHRGVFITSSRFTQGARDYANAVPTRIVLIDGRRLAELMIKYGVGVQVKKSYDVVEIDEDFFE
ncbi:restriction endonuclease [Nesterenkonia sp. CF4.4]|uniref:restriction endonuclease n=1 Tax=Nesterenkonia sp. CF4.4 TaxID=3373079 RepID=UPI003EE46664